MNNVFQKKNVIQYPRFIKLIVADLMEKCPSIPRRLYKDYHSIKDDTPLVSVYSVGNVIFQGMRIPDAFLTSEIRATDDYKEYETVFVRVDVPINQPQPVVSTQGTHRNTPRAHRTPTLTASSPQGKKRNQQARETSDDRERDEVAEVTILSLTLHKTAFGTEAQENVAKVQEKLDEEEIERIVEGGEDKESYASEFADSMLNDDVDDSDTRIEPESYKEYPENVNDGDEEIEKEKKDDEIEIEKKMMMLRIRMRLLKRKIMMRRCDQIPSHIKNKFITRDFFMGKIQEVLDHCNKVVPEMTITQTNEMIKEEMPRLVNLVVNKDHENITLNLYLTTSSSTAKKSTADLQKQLYLEMKTKPQDQAADPELWEILKAKFEKS
ncbi:hypothetical protein Tco_0024079 [Tanacetum coccineum]